MAAANVAPTVWLAYINAAKADAFRCSFGWPVEESTHLIGTGGAMYAGAPATIAYRISQVGNYPDLPAQQRPAPAVNGARYRGIMMVPMFGDGKAIGVVQIERGTRQRFDPAPQSLARALAALYGSVLPDPRLA